MSFEATLNNSPSVAKATTKDTRIAFLHSLEELGDVGRLVTVSGVNFENPITSCRKSVAIPAHVGIDHASIFRGPNYSQGWLLFCKLTQKFQRVVFAHVV